MLDKLREWLSDNLRYILLGLALLAVLILLLFGGKALTSALKGKAKEPDAKTEQPKENAAEEPTNKETEQEDKAASEGKAENTALEKNAYPEVNTVIDTFYTAWGKKDVANMKKVTDTFDAADESKVTNATYIESYTNINTYTKKGVTDGSYVALVSYDLKFVDIDTPAPGLTQVYLNTDESGKVYICNNTSDTEIQERINQVMLDQDVKDLIASVETKFQEAQNSDEKLKAFEEELGSETSLANQAAIGSTIAAKNDCNVRTEPNADSKIVLELKANQQVKKLENAENGWIKVDVEGKTGYVRGDLLG